MARRVSTDFRKLPKETNKAWAIAAGRRKTTTGIYDEMTRLGAPIVTPKSDIRKMARRRVRSSKGVRAIVSHEDAMIWRKDRQADAYAHVGRRKATKATIHLHPMLRYHTPRYIRDVIDHELDHVKVHRRGGSKYWS